MARSPPIPVRSDPGVPRRLSSFAASHPGLSLSAAANLLVDEGLRTTEHPGFVFRDGPTGRRAALAGGPDVWEVMRAIKSARVAELELSEAEVVALVVENSGVPARMVRTALSYWASHPSESDAEIPLPDHPDTPPNLATRHHPPLPPR